MPFYINDELISPRFSDLYDYYVPDAKEVRLPDHNSMFSFRFASLNYQLQHRVHYQYMLEGYDEQWHTAGKDRMASYANLPSGTYTLRVKVSLHETPDKFEEKAITIVVPPTFLFSTMAIWIYMLAGAALGIAFLAWRQKRIRKEVMSANKT